jgi:hypothetical protein
MKNLEVVITIGLLISAAYTLWAVFTPNHLFVG